MPCYRSVSFPCVVAFFSVVNLMYYLMHSLSTRSLLLAIHFVAFATLALAAVDLCDLYRPENRAVAAARSLKEVMSSLTSRYMWLPLRPATYAILWGTIILMDVGAILSGLSPIVLPLFVAFFITSASLVSLYLEDYRDDPIPLAEAFRLAAGHCSKIWARVSAAVSPSDAAILLSALFLLASILSSPFRPRSLRSLLLSDAVVCTALALLIVELCETLRLWERAGQVGRFLKELAPVVWRRGSDAAAAWYGSAKAKAADFFRDAALPAVSAFWGAVRALGGILPGRVDCDMSVRASWKEASFSFQFEIGPGGAAEERMIGGGGGGVLQVNNQVPGSENDEGINEEIGAYSSEDNNEESSENDTSEESSRDDHSSNDDSEESSSEDKSSSEYRSNDQSDDSGGSGSDDESSSNGEKENSEDDKSGDDHSRGGKLDTTGWIMGKRTAAGTEVRIAATANRSEAIVDETTMKDSRAFETVPTITTIEATETQVSGSSQSPSDDDWLVVHTEDANSS